jgi:hypothetical protein
MKNNNAHLITTLFIMLFGAQSCDPQRFCTEPKCLYSDVSTEIQATLTGNLDSIIHIGDTLHFYMKIPDTMSTNYGNIVFGSLLQNSYFGYFCSGGDSIIGSGEGAFTNTKQAIEKKIIYGGDTLSGKYWNYNTREYECLFIPVLKGKYVFEIYGGRIEMKANDNKSWLINPSINLNCPKRFSQYTSWMDTSMRANAYSIVSQKKGWYCFEVK